MQIRSRVFETPVDGRPVGAIINFSRDDAAFDSDILVEALVLEEDLRKLWGDLGNILKEIDKASREHPDG